jgi:hypothetical protein
MRRSSPLGGGGGSELVMLRSIPSPIFQMNQNIAKPTASQMMVSNIGAQTADRWFDSRIGSDATLNQRRSMMKALAKPPPSHIVCSP